MEGRCADLDPKVRFLTDFGFQLGPKIRRHRPVSSVSDKRSQHCEAPPSEACPPYLPASTGGIEMAPKTGLFGFIFGIKFWHHFWHAFFLAFLAFWWPFGSPLAPFGHFGCILGSISAPFWLTFTSFWHHFFQPRFCIDFSAAPRRVHGVFRP